MIPSMQRLGRFIAIEGIDGSGKTSLADLLGKSLQTLGCEIVPCKRAYFESTQSILNALRKRGVAAPRIIALAYALDYFMQMERVISPAVSAGKFVISDRYIFSSIAYNTASGISKEWSRTVYEGSVIPDEILFLDINPNVALSRRTDHDPLAKGFDQDIIGFQTKVQRVYQSLSIEYKFTILNATIPLTELANSVISTFMSRGYI